MKLKTIVVFLLCMILLATFLSFVKQDQDQGKDPDPNGSGSDVSDTVDSSEDSRDSSDSSGDSSIQTFNIFNVSYSFENGMTWSDWVASLYSANAFMIDSDKVIRTVSDVNGNKGIVLYVNVLTGESGQVLPDDPILIYSESRVAYSLYDDSAEEETGTPITFSMDGVDYDAYEGMTWEEYIETYGGFYTDGTYVFTDSERTYYVRDFDSYETRITISTVITDRAMYTVGAS